ncbi:MAG: ATP-binding protein [Bacteroidales bacterium]|jgi:hypothetical protein|nr:ATP-binding protein [Bacteroidales bacterium]
MNTNHINPFLTTGYTSKEYFCDRQNELQNLQRMLTNENNLTLISARRLGKSALIYRLFESLEEENYVCIYIDIFATVNLKDFIETLALAIFKRFPEKKNFGKRFLEFLKSFRPVISYDALNGQPEIHFEFSRPADYEHTLRSIFRFLDSQQVAVILAIDEFQQVTAYPETNTEALLRTIIQTLQNIRFLFSGSKKHLMFDMFNTAKRPFFASTQLVNLSEIPPLEYKKFIRSKFEEQRRTIDDESMDFILSWTLTHTYYTQVICNQVFAQKERHIGIEVVKRVCDELLKQQQINFMQYRNLLAPLQWRLLIAIAKEGTLSEPQSQIFLQKYQIGAASSSKKALQSLLDKEMVCDVEMAGKIAYRIYDVFLLRWLERTF